LLIVTTPLPDLLAAVPTLNDPNEPFSYTVEGDRIVGTWDIVKATSLYPTEIEHVDKKYAITVELDEEKSTFDFHEKKTATSGSADADGGFSARLEGFSGKSSSKEFSFTFGGVNKTDEGVSMDPVVYSFETSRIKEPLFTFLQQHGWKRKKGFLGGLFGR
jgi:hypothetical protein